MIDWILLVGAVIVGGVVLVRPRWIGFPEGFSGSTLIGFTLVSIGMTSPLILHLDHMMLEAGAGPDAFIGTWNLWWTKQALLHGSNPFTTSFLYYPSGTGLALHTHSVTYGVLTLPLQLLFANDGAPGLFSIYNLILLGSFTLTGYFTYRLALAETGHRAASLFAGLVVAFSAFRFANTVRLHVIATEFLVLAIWAFVAWIRQPSGIRLLGVLGAGLLLANASLEYTVLASLGFGWLVLSRILPTRLRSTPLIEPGPGRQNLFRSALPEARKPGRFARWMVWPAVGLIVAASWPLASRIIRRIAAGGINFDPRLGEYFSADVLDLILPNPRHPWWGEPFALITGRLHFGDAGFGTHFGVIVVLLFALTIRYSVRAHQGRRWALGAIIFAVLALGPRLHINGDALPLPLPQALLSHVPLLGGTRTPIRYFALAQIFIAIAIASGWTGWLRSRRRAALAKAGDRPLTLPATAPTRPEVFLGALLLLTSLAAPLPFRPQPIPNVYRLIHQRAGGETATLLHVPGLRSRDDLLYQTVHGQRLLDDVSTAIPLHNGTKEALHTRAWETFALAFAQSGFVAGLSEEQHRALLELAHRFLEKYSVRWIVVPASPADQSIGTADRIPHNMLGVPVYQAYLENFRLLGPVWEHETAAFTVFEF